MPSQPIDTGWGFNAVIDLIESDFDVPSSLSTASTVKPNDTALGQKSGNESIPESPLHTQYVPRLGDFTKLFGELGISPPEPVAPASPVDSEGLISSDDAILNEQIESSSTGEGRDPDSPLAGLTAKQQKQARKKAAKKERKMRKALETQAVVEKAIIDVQPAIQPRTRSNVGAKVRPTAPTPLVAQSDESKPQPPIRILQPSHVPADSVPLFPREHVGSLAQSFTSHPGQSPQTNFMNISHDGFNKPQVKQILKRPSLHEAKFSNGLQPQSPSSLRLNHGLVPRTVQPVSAPRFQNISAAQTYDTPIPQPVTAPLYEPTTLGQKHCRRTDVKSAQEWSCVNQTPYKIRSPNRFPTPVQNPATGAAFQSLTIRPQTERHLHFLNTLLANFPADAPWLLSPMSLSNQEIKAQGIHCFVDASNIMIGFKDMLRRHGQQHLEMSFDTLALLMERRRPVAKRIYAGSHREAAPLPHVTKLVETSKAVGYENLVKEQVFIRREDSERKKFFKDVERMGWNKANQIRSGLSSGSDSETGPTASMPPSAPKWVEQGVDEILHLKMCQSIIDTEVPTTMVLATGDGNAAEFSDGFLANVERALKNGWNVELVSWKQQMSAGYRKKSWRAKWGDRFRVIELDDYLESLIDTS